VDRVRPGEFFGEMSVVLGGRRSVRAVAASDARVLEIDRETFQAMCLDRPEIALRVIERLTARVLQLEEQMGTLAVTELVRPVVAHLLEAARAEGEDHHVETTLLEIARAAGLSMLDAHRAIQELLDLKLVRLEHDLLWIPDLDALAAHSGNAARD
jgi:CRP-like cAMP-binding protein